MKALTTGEIENKMDAFPNWEYAEGALHTSMEFGSFRDAFSMMTRIAFEAEEMNHHPDWSNVYNELNISLSTHDADGVTQKDFQLAEIIDGLLG